MTFLNTYERAPIQNTHERTLFERSGERTVSEYKEGKVLARQFIYTPVRPECFLNLSRTGYETLRNPNSIRTLSRPLIVGSALMSLACHTTHSLYIALW